MFISFLATALIAVAPLVQSAQDEKDKPQAPPASRPAESGEDGSGFRKPAQAAGMDSLLRRQEAQPVSPTPSRLGKETDRSSVNDSLWQDGSLLIDRSGRVIRSGDRFDFEFAVEGEQAPRRFEILKNQLLELVEAEYERGATEFVISAEVTRFHETNYLLLRKVLRRVSNGNLSP